MGILDLTSDLSKGAGTNFSQIEGRHGGTVKGGTPVHPKKHSAFDDKAGQSLSKTGGRHGGTVKGGTPPHPKTHSTFDNKVGNKSNPQTFEAGGYTVTGNKEFKRPNDSGLEKMLS